MKSEKKPRVHVLRKYRRSTEEARVLRLALEERGVRVYTELYDRHKHIDLSMPDAKLNIEVDGIQHLTDPHQIVADLNRGYYSHKSGFSTMHIPNVLIHTHITPIADALAEAARLREKKLRVHLA